MIEFEGWEESSLLPEGWIFRVNWEGFVKSNDKEEPLEGIAKSEAGTEEIAESNEHLVVKARTKFSSNIAYLSREGKAFESLRTATEYMTKMGYKRAEILRCREFLQERNQKSIVLRENWLESDTVPPGWKIRNSGARSFVLSPDGRQFRSRLQAIVALAPEKSYQEDLAWMREKLLEHEGWQTSSLLPAHWIFKVKGIEDKQLLQLTSKYKLLRGMKSVLVHLETSAKYTKDHIDKYNQFWQQFGAESLDTKYTWSTSPTLPEGCRLRKAGDREFILSPREEQFRTRFVALKSLLKMNPIPEKEAAAMKEKMMEHEGWKKDVHLPKGWLCKQFPERIKKGRKQKFYQKVFYLTEQGECFHGLNAALEYMRGSSKYNKNEVAKMEGSSAADGGAGDDEKEAVQDDLGKDVEGTAEPDLLFASREITPMRHLGDLEKDADRDDLEMDLNQEIIPIRPLHGQNVDGSDFSGQINKTNPKKKDQPGLSDKNEQSSTTVPKHGWGLSLKLPKGWKYRILPRKVGRKKQLWFLSPQVRKT